MPRKARGALLLSMIALAAPASAAAATVPATSTATSTTTPVAAPVRGRLRTSLQGVFKVNSRYVTVTGRPLVVTGIATPFVPGQVVKVKVRIGRRLLKSGTYRLFRSRRGTFGRFSIRLSSRVAGNLSINAVHAATPQLAKVTAVPQNVGVVVPGAGPGSTGTFVSLIQSRLAALHFAVPQDGVYDQLTQNAVLAYRKLRGWLRITTLDSRVIGGLFAGVGRFQVRYPRQGRHVEADLTDQTLALINGANVYRIYPISSGKPSTPTVLGTYHVYSKVPGYLPDGMYYSNFWYRGYAIHGYDPAPTYPASHGCLRLPIDEAISVYGWVQLGTAVDVYYGAN
jgi:hypothetical protein